MWLLSEAWGASGALRQALGDLPRPHPPPAVRHAPVHTSLATLNYSFSKKGGHFQNLGGAAD